MHQQKKEIPYASKRKKDDPSITRELILDAALDIFTAKGYKGATTRMIAMEADVNEVTLFRHFGSKEGVLQNLMKREFQRHDFLSELRPKLTRDPIIDLTEIGVYITQAMESLMPIIKLIITVIPQSDQKDINTWMPKEGIDHMKEIFKELGADDPFLTAVTFQSFFIRSHIIKAFLGEDPVITLDRETIKRFVTILVHGMHHPLNNGTPDNVVNRFDKDEV